MKITRFETFFVRPRWLILKVHTDEGIVGIGEPILECRAHSCAAAVQEIGQNIIGENPLEIERLWQRMYRGGFYRGGPVIMSAISGIEMALLCGVDFFNAIVEVHGLLQQLGIVVDVVLCHQHLHFLFECCHALAVGHCPVRLTAYGICHIGAATGICSAPLATKQQRDGAQ